MEDVGLQGKGGGREFFMMRDYLIYVLIYSGRTRGGVLVAEEKRGGKVFLLEEEKVLGSKAILSSQKNNFGDFFF